MSTHYMYALDDPFCIPQIDLVNYLESVKASRVIKIAKDFYDRMGQHDPHAIYQITDQNLVYMGDKLINYNTNTMSPCKYVLGTRIVDELEEYVIYMLTPIPVEIIHGFDANNMVRMLSLLNHVGSHDVIKVKTRLAVESFIDGNINFLTLMVSLVAEAGYKDHPQLQAIISLQETCRWGVKDEMEVPIKVAASGNIPLPILDVYNKIYDPFIPYIGNKDGIKKNINKICREISNYISA